MHVFALPFQGKLSFAGVDDAVIRKYRADRREELGRRLNSLADAAGFDRSEITRPVRRGEAAQVIVELAQEVEYGLLVVGKHGIREFENLLLGSITKQFLAKARGDVLVACDAGG